MNGVVQLLTRFGAARLGAMGAVTLALVGFFAFVILRMSQPAMGVLFTDMSSSDAASVVRELDARGVRYDLKEDGQTILAPRPDLSRLRMELAGKGLPSSGGVGYEIFDKGDAFSSTSFVQNINHLRALEGELARTIRTVARVASARVHLAIPERRLFERDKEAPRASIALKLRGDLGAEQIQAIRHLVASAVEGLTPEHISVVDERGRLLADGAGGSEDSLTNAAGEDKRVAMERKLRSHVEDLLAGIVGSGKSRVQVAAELDFGRIENRSESFDPESKVVRSTQTRGETSTSNNGENQVSVGTELPGAKDAEKQPSPKDTAAKNEEVVNYEISRTTRTEILGAGRLKRLSVAVLVDGTYGKGPGTEPAYQPRSKEDLERIAALVRTAVGFDKGRGDQVEVVNLPFAESATPTFETEKESLISSLLHPSREDVLRWIELGVMSLLTLIVLMVVVRPLMKRLLAPDALPAAIAALSGTVPALTDGSGAGSVRLSESAQMAEAMATAAAAQITKLGELSKSQPKQAAAVLRSWMAESQS